MVHSRLRSGVFCTFLLAVSLIIPGQARAADDADSPATLTGVAQAQADQCEATLEAPDATTTGPKRVPRRKAAVESEAAPAQAQTWTLKSFLVTDPERNLAVQHPFTIANAAEKAYAMIMHEPAREALDPLYRVKPVKIYPMLAGEHAAAGGRMVVGQEESIAAFVSFLHSAARGDRSGKTLGFPGPAGTGKTELLYVLDNLERNLGKEAKYKQLSYRFKNLAKIPYLKSLFKWDGGKPVTEYVNPDLARSPFTLLRPDMQEAVLGYARPRIQSKWNMTISDGWEDPEPKSQEILRAIFEYKFPQIAEGTMTVDDLTEDQYLDTLNEFVVIVPKQLVQPLASEPNIIRAQTDNPNYQALFVRPNLGRLNAYGDQSALGVDYSGKIMQQDGRLLMFDELFRNPGEFLNILLEVIQNHIAEVDYGRPVRLDVVPIWNSNDESIERSSEDNAIKALINRTDARSMRSLLASSQIESVIMFQIGLNKFKMRKLGETEIKPFVHSEVYPPTDAFGRTYSAHGRYAIYYEMDGQDILLAPYTLNYIAWLASATRFVTDIQKIGKYAGELNMVRANPSLFTDAINRLKISLGEKTPERADLMELSRVRYLVNEGEGGIDARSIETWFKEALEIAKNSGKNVLTPNMVDKAFQKLLDEKSIKPGKETLRAEWQILRERVKLELLLPKLDQEVKAIVSGDGSKAERMYDQVEKEFIALASDQDATEVIPEDGSQRLPVRRDILEEIRGVYRQKFGRDFQPTFLLRQLAGARRGAQPARDPDLLEAVRIFISRHESATADYVSAFDSFYRGDSVDPNVRQRVAEVEPVLAAYGYNLDSFKEAVAFMAQLQGAEQLARKRQQQQQQP